MPAGGGRRSFDRDGDKVDEEGVAGAEDADAEEEPTGLGFEAG